ncbi:hypothetical protein FVR03_22645 [Pontibacter qinzhouensis]|uniref:Uncharacterized protein n=1 Tax=Pontibacter qinzhouensis TaxID=2603253 RepID=A0A5C8IPD2_9BACT|nr:hypothetical protein [Pontibacter qinzhouensis]TXK23388.1 hypothetical protein FVR03_22645 [Pontibacter qinzhouensis]
MDYKDVKQTGWRDVEKKLEEIIYLLEEHGLFISPSSRLNRYHKILSSLGKDLVDDLPKGFTTKEFRQIYPEVHQLYHGVIELCKADSFGKWSEKLKFLTSGTELPEKDSDHSSRNYQFELFIAGLLNKAGIHPICDEPDIRIEYQDGDFGIAIKRLNSYKNLRDNLRKARKQILRTERPGIIMLDLSLITNPQNLIPHAKSINNVTNHLIDFLNLFCNDNYQTIRNIIKEDSVFGIIFYVSTLCTINGVPGFSSRMSVLNLCPEDSSLMKNLSLIVNSLSKQSKDK